MRHQEMITKMQEYMTQFKNNMEAEYRNYFRSVSPSLNMSLKEIGYNENEDLNAMSTFGNRYLSLPPMNSCSTEKNENSTNQSKGSQNVGESSMISGIVMINPIQKNLR